MVSPWSTLAMAIATALAAALARAPALTTTMFGGGTFGGGTTTVGGWQQLGAGRTDADGRLRTLLPEGVALEAAVYRLTFDTEVYFEAEGVEGFYPEAAIVFAVNDAAQHYHVPLLLSPFGYSTYRGS